MGRRGYPAEFRRNVIDLITHRITAGLREDRANVVATIADDALGTG